MLALARPVSSTFIYNQIVRGSIADGSTEPIVLRITTFLAAYNDERAVANNAQPCY